MYLKNWLLIFVAMAIAASMATLAFADKFMDEMAAVDEYKLKVDKYFEGVKAYEGSVDNKNRIVNERLNDLETREQQQSPPAGQFWPEPAPQPTVVAVPVPVPTWGWRYYRYWNAALVDWVFAPIWCPANWVAPYDWYPVSYNDRYQFRHFSHGRVDGGRIFFNQRQPINLHNRQQFQPRGNMPVVRSPQHYQSRGVAMTRPPQNFQRQPQMRGNVLVRRQPASQNIGRVPHSQPRTQVQPQQQHRSHQPH